MPRETAALVLLVAVASVSPFDGARVTYLRFEKTGSTLVQRLLDHNRPKAACAAANCSGAACDPCPNLKELEASHQILGRFQEVSREDQPAPRLARKECACSGARVVLVTMIRSPVDHFFSELFWAAHLEQCTKDHDMFDRFNNQPGSVTVDEMRDTLNRIECSRVVNQLPQVLGGANRTHDWTSVKRARSNLARFASVGIYEFFEASIILMSHELELTKPPDFCNLNKMRENVRDPAAAAWHAGFAPDESRPQIVHLDWRRAFSAPVISAVDAHLDTSTAIYNDALQVFKARVSRLSRASLLELCGRRSADCTAAQHRRPACHLETACAAQAACGERVIEAALARMANTTQ